MPLPSQRDPEDLRRSLENWFRSRVGDDAKVGSITIPEGTGMSSETLLFDLDHDGTTQSLVARLRPSMTDWPVFPVYDLEQQAKAMQLVAAHSDVPVPEVKFVEPDDAQVGAPFIVMGRVGGNALPDMPPYTFGGSFLDDLTPEQRRQYQRSFMSVQARLHRIDISNIDTSFIAPSDGDALTRQLTQYRDYFEWAREGRDVPLIERGLAWLEANKPSDPGPTVLNWGDARPGNMLVDGTTPTAVLDWEMVDLGPAAVDVGWAIFMHSFFQEVCKIFELPGFPEMFRLDEVIADYAAAGGALLPDLDWFVMLASVRFAIIAVRTSSREAAYGNREVPDDHADLIMHRAMLEAQLAERS
jgi:aminoglycoside phosphotransferase (APT) family kinase protein